MLVTECRACSLADPNGDEADGAGPDSGDIMVTIALSAHDVERWVWFTEGEEPANYAQMWLTLQNDATDTGGSSPVDEGNAFQ